MAEIIILTSCDNHYHKLYSNDFKKSAKDPTHIYLCESNPWGDKSYYACARYLILPEMIEEHGSVFVSDIDVVFLKSIPEPDTKIGLVKTSPKPHRTEWEQRGMHVMAGLFYCSDVDIAEKIRYKINELPKKWFVDQIAIHEVIKKEKSRTYFSKPPTKPMYITKDDFALVPRGKDKGILKGKFVKNLVL